MAKAIEQSRSKLTIGHFGLGIHGDAPGTPGQQVHDGDTVNVRAIGNFGVRFLGIDTPEVSLALPGTDYFVSIGDSRWQGYLDSPVSGFSFAAGWDAGLRAHLDARMKPGTAANHLKHALAAKAALRGMVESDMAAMHLDKDCFGFFLVFANEVIDRYGRLLAFIHPDQPQGAVKLPSYNVRQLPTGMACPYFIWPNINPFRTKPTLRAAVIPPGGAATLAQSDPVLRQARQDVQAARNSHLGIFEQADPLLLEPFEVRFLARQAPPDRWVIDLSRNDTMILKPENYYTIPNPEDRLFIPEDFLCLFTGTQPGGGPGWTRQP
jgi:endonuclease YncB( thermonuclease family)